MINKNIADFYTSSKDTDADKCIKIARYINLHKISKQDLLDTLQSLEISKASIRFIATRITNLSKLNARFILN